MRDVCGFAWIDKVFGLLYNNDMQKEMVLFSADTSPEAARRQTEALRRMGLSGRAALTFELMDDLRNVTQAGIRSRHPEYSDQQVIQAYLKLILDPDLFGQLLPGCEIRP